MKEKPKLKKGFAVMTPEQRCSIASLGGLAVSKGKAGKQHMRDLGAAGGAAVHKAWKLVKR